MIFSGQRNLFRWSNQVGKIAVFDIEQNFSRNGSEIRSKNFLCIGNEHGIGALTFLGRKRRRIRMAFHIRNRIGSGIGVGTQRYLKSTIRIVVMNVLKRWIKKNRKQKLYNLFTLTERFEHCLICENHSRERRI